MNQETDHARANAASWMDSINAFVEARSQETWARLEDLREERGECRDTANPMSCDDLAELERRESLLDDYDDAEAARERAQEPILSVEVRSGWNNPSETMKAEEFMILLPETPPAPVEFDLIVEAEALWEAMPQRPKMTHGGDRACYIPGWDEIRMPNRAAFPTAEGFYETLFHEAGHSTGHSSRLNRKEVMAGGMFGLRAYSLEELVAELSAVLS
ncbi:zincin-like metallopeptidase domain-containing protein [Geothrix sp. PMB-07]|uniref:zincin-like metallopeptidase domain-containing protein n=1 Tax=Geothrix sp. PMB-07 TaxID=3068640 RepID=UPI00274288F4|nr:zincin-like metallopeptidase domain-containing protein [Geothrix sp. PMB-07]WLT32757.1 zincin-like metallopeptidase domain-containing protein [Geothrix sp. PMB-07]